MYVQRPSFWTVRFERKDFTRADRTKKFLDTNLIKNYVRNIWTFFENIRLKSYFEKKNKIVFPKQNMIRFTSLVLLYRIPFKMLFKWSKCFLLNFIGLYQWCLTLSQYGVAKIRNAPLKEDQCAKLANRIGFIRETHFGREYVVRANPKAKNYSYTSNPLQFHTDLPFYDYAPGVTILHCIAQSKSTGAYNILADGFYVAQKLKQEHPQEYKCLTTTPVNWCDYGDENGFRFEKVLRMPAIRYVVEYFILFKKIFQFYPSF